MQRAHPNRQPNWASSNTIDSESILLHILSCTSIQPYSPSQLVPYGQLINHQYYSPKAATIKQALDDFPSHLITPSSIRYLTLCLPQKILTDIQLKSNSVNLAGQLITVHKGSDYWISRTWACRFGVCAEQHFSSWNLFLFNIVMRCAVALYNTIMMLITLHTAFVFHVVSVCHVVSTHNSKYFNIKNWCSSDFSS